MEWAAVVVGALQAVAISRHMDSVDVTGVGTVQPRDLEIILAVGGPLGRVLGQK